MEPQDYLDNLLGAMPRVRPNARSVRAAGQNSLCARRTVLEAGGRANLRELARACGAPTDPDPSLFAIARGDRHEEGVLGAGGTLLPLLRDEIGLPIVECAVLDLRAITPGAGLANLKRRHNATRRWLRRILEGHPDAPNVIRGAILRVVVAGFEMFLEPDAVVAVFVAGVLYVVEIKSYSAFDGVVPPAKAAAAAAQSAVYIHAVRNEIRQIGFDPAVVSDTAFLITATNASLHPSIHRMNLGPDVRRVGRDLKRMASATEVLADLLAADPEGIVSAFDPQGLGDEKLPETVEAQRRNRDTMSRIPLNFVPDCLPNCPLGNVCRDEVRAGGRVSSFGLEHAQVAGGVETTGRLVQLAQGARPGAGEESVASIMSVAAELLAEAGHPPRVPQPERGGRSRRRGAA